ncbi:hypothetical protein SUDANB95_03262 [Actinosynnema sp. ALI-1.44]
MIVTFTGSSRQNPSSMPSNPCHSAPGASVQHSALVRSRSSGASAKACTAPVTGSVTSPGCHVPKNQSGRSPASRIRRPSLATACRNRIASVIASSVNHRPPGPSIIAAATSRPAIIGYSGDVVACIMNVSLNCRCSTGDRGEFLTCTMEL